MLGVLTAKLFLRTTVLHKTVDAGWRMLLLEGARVDMRYAHFVVPNYID